MAPRSFNDLLVDRAAAHAITLLRFEAALRPQILGYLLLLAEQIEERLRAFRVGEGATASSGLRVRTLRAQVQASIASAFGAVADAHAAGMAAVAGIESAYVGSQIGAVAVGARLGLNILTAGQLRRIATATSILGAPSRSWWARQAGDTMERFRRAVDLGIALGETTDEIVRRVRGRATGRRHRYEINGREHTFVEFAGGVMDTSTRHAEALVRTSVQAVAGAARRDTYEENQDVVKGIVQVSTLDTRTTAVCIARANKAWTLPDYQPIGHDIAYAGGPPLHWQCRSTTAPLLRSWSELGIKIADTPPPPGVRWSRLDGDLPADISMDAFLRRRTDAQVDDMLGNGIAELWRSGRISLEQIIDRQTSRPLSLAEIQRRYGFAS